jgi:formamidopyrimidine-DNA glycosylase
MPELPEVETIKRQLGDVLVGEEIVLVRVLREKSFQGNEEELEGRRIRVISRRAKMLVFEFDDWDKCLLVHLKMTGQLVFVAENLRLAGGHPSADWVNSLPSKHTRVIFEFKRGGKLFFNDLRVFGWVKLISLDDYQLLVEKLPPDVVDDSFIKDYFRKVIGNSGRQIKLVLMDQAKFGGMGNIYANDALFLAGIDPRRRADSLGIKEQDRLFEAVKLVISEGIEYGGATAADEKYVDVSGLGGKYQEHFRVYERNGKECLVCGEKIRKISLGGRGTYFCEKCQK